MHFALYLSVSVSIRLCLLLFLFAMPERWMFEWQCRKGRGVQGLGVEQAKQNQSHVHVLGA